MSGTLFVVATPIGNLEDITFRAVRILREADLIAAEDTRRTAKLLGHYGINTPTISFHDHNARSRLPQLLRRLEAGENVALVTDAGTPGISDPGLELVRACIAQEIAIDPLPGPTAPVTAAIASGFPLDPLTILGFPPTRAKTRNQWLSQLGAVPHTFTFFEAPHRIHRALSELHELLGERQICVAREVTKVHQQLLRGTAAAILGLLPAAKGEFTIVVGPAAPPSGALAATSDQDIYREFGHSTDSSGLGRRGVVKELAKKHGRSTRDVYAIIERQKSSGV
jgi:16S rRNA (cytidine1402-2'-O)-methyltransferase